MTDSLLHTVLIYGHAVGGLVAFGLGCLVLRPRQQKESAVFRAYFVSLWVMVLLLALVVGADWAELPPVSRMTFGGLTLLALYTGLRGWQARRLLYNQTADWQGDYVSHVGFTLISLFDGFVIVGALDMNAPGWIVGAVGVLGVVVGISAINLVKSHLKNSFRASAQNELAELGE